MEGKVTFYVYCFKVIFLLGFVTMFYAPGFFEEGELPPGSVSPGVDNMDCFMQQMCDALHDGSLGIDLNIDLGQVNNVESTVPYSGISTSNVTFLKHGEGRSSVFAASAFSSFPHLSTFRLPYRCRDGKAKLLEARCWLIS